jgi:high-affinity Fe2+/Pb2+ permease
MSHLIVMDQNLEEENVVDPISMTIGLVIGCFIGGVLSRGMSDIHLIQRFPVS